MLIAVIFVMIERGPVGVLSMIMEKIIEVGKVLKKYRCPILSVLNVTLKVETFYLP